MSRKAGYSLHIISINIQIYTIGIRPIGIKNFFGEYIYIFRKIYAGKFFGLVKLFMNF